MLFIFCLFKTGVLKRRDLKMSVNLLFGRYLELVQRLQSKYSMESSEPDKFWALDDFQHLAYLFGASQLVDSPYMPEASCNI